jgi:hypothetical protein
MKQHLTLTEAADQIGVRNYQLAYVLNSKLVEDVELRIGGRRIFQPGDISRMKKYFASKKKEKSNV